MALSGKWTATMDAAKQDARFIAYDGLIQTEVTEYNARFKDTPGFVALDWRIFKALVLVESGGPANPAWQTRAMQIGNTGDPAFGVLRDGAEGSVVVMSPQLKVDVATKPIDEPTLNIRAGLAYALTRHASFGWRSVQDTGDTALYAHTVHKGESLERIARKEGTTVEDLRQQAAAEGQKVSVLHVGQVLHFHHSKLTQQITGWQAVTPESLQRLYNGNGDPSYAEKIRYVQGVAK